MFAGQTGQFIWAGQFNWAVPTRRRWVEYLPLPPANAGPLGSGPGDGALVYFNQRPSCPDLRVNPPFFPSSLPLSLLSSTCPMEEASQRQGP